MTDDRFDTLDPDLGSYLLGELAPEERARFERRLADEPALRAQVERLAPVVTRLDDVPDQAWEALPPAPPLETLAPAAARSRRRWLPTLMPRAWAATALAAVALLAAGIGIGTLIDGGGSGGGSAVPQGPAIVLAPLGGAPASASADARMVGPNRMLLRVDDLPPAPAGSYYEAWLLDGPGRVVPVASFSVGDDGRAVVELPLPAAADRYRYLDVSLQRIDGGAEHSGDSLLRGNVS